MIVIRFANWNTRGFSPEEKAPLRVIAFGWLLLLLRKIKAPPCLVGLVWNSVLPKALLDHFNSWKTMSGAFKAKHLWRTSFLAIPWVIWRRHRNSRCFDGRFTDIKTVLDYIKFETTTWVYVGPQCRGIPADMIVQKFERMGLSEFLSNENAVFA